MSSGIFTDKVIGDKATISLAGSVFNLKMNFALNDGCPAERSANSSGLDYAFGAQDGTFICEIEASTPQLATIEGWRDRGTNGEIGEIAVIINLPPVGGGATVTGSFNAKVHRYEIVSTSPDGFVLVRLTSVLTSEAVTWA